MTRPLNQRFKSARLKAGHSLRQMEKVVGVSFSTLARFERGVGEIMPFVENRVRHWLETGGSSAPRVVPEATEPWSIRFERRMEDFEERLSKLEGKS